MVDHNDTHSGVNDDSFTYFLISQMNISTPAIYSVKYLKCVKAATK